jgi:phosphoribosylformylglycinamidine synthase
MLDCKTLFMVDSISPLFTLIFQKNTVTFLIRQKEDMIGRSKKESLKNRFKIGEILNIKHGVLWKIKVNSGDLESTTNKILQSNILYNPLSYECYRIH